MRVNQAFLFLFLGVTSAFTATTHSKHRAVGGFSSSSHRLHASKLGARGARANNKNALVMMPSGTPMVPYQPPGQEYAQFVDIYSRLYRDRIMLIGNYIDEQAANNIISILLYLRKENPEGKITLYFNVPGADLRPAMAVYDILCQHREDCEISTLNLGMATGMGAFLCGAGTKGKRGSMPNARFLLQRTGLEKVFRGQASDIGLEVQSMKKANDRMEMELAKMTGQPVSKIREDLKRDFYLSSEEAVAYGLIDYVLIPDDAKRFREVQYERDPWTGEKIVVPEKEVGLGVFEGDEEQRYQGQGGDGWGKGTGWRQDGPREGGPSGAPPDIYEPPTQK